MIIDYREQDIKKNANFSIGFIIGIILIITYLKAYSLGPVLKNIVGFSVIGMIIFLSIYLFNKHKDIFFGFLSTLITGLLVISYVTYLISLIGF